MKTKTKKSGTVNHDKTALEQSDDYMSSVASIITDRILTVIGGTFLPTGAILVFLAAAGMDGRMETAGVLGIGGLGLFTALIGLGALYMKWGAK